MCKRNRIVHGLEQRTGQCLGWRLDGPIIRRGYGFPQTVEVLQVLCHEEVEISEPSQRGYVRSKTEGGEDLFGKDEIMFYFDFL